LKRRICGKLLILGEEEEKEEEEEGFVESF
jgi:hypothetical protein